jgi:SAM-dependent methyltransferase
VASRPRTRQGMVTQATETLLERDQVAAGRLPPRYAEPWFEPFEQRVRGALRPGVAILDVGSGRYPTIGLEERPTDCTYVGLDASAAELALAPAGTYDETICADVTLPDSALVGRFDLIVSWQVLEHVKPLPRTFELMRSYLRPGGKMVAQLSGGLSAFAILARVVPHAASSRLMARLLGVAADEKFPTYYDHCRFSALDRILSTWSFHEIVPRYKGATYFRFFRPLEAGYLRYEDLIFRHDWRELATHYLVDATR